MSRGKGGRHPPWRDLLHDESANGSGSQNSRNGKYGNLDIEIEDEQDSKDFVNNFAVTELQPN